MPSKLKKLDRLNNRLKTFGKISDCMTEVELDGNVIPAEGHIPGYITLRLQGNEVSDRSKRHCGSVILLGYKKIEGIGLLYTVHSNQKNQPSYYILVTKYGTRRL